MKNMKPIHYEWFKRYQNGETSEQIARDIGVTRQHIQQVLSKFGEEYLIAKAAGHQARKKQCLVEITCLQCQKSKSARPNSKYCSRACFYRHKTQVDYPDWVAGRAITPKNFTKDEWRQLNSLRLKAGYQRHKEKRRATASAWQKKNRARQNLYQVRSLERKLYGVARTPLPNIKNPGAVRD
jgi:hypothetical protein